MPSTANPLHTRPASAALKSATTAPPTTCTICQDFITADQVGNIPAVSFIKAPAYQDGHAGYSNPLDEQTFVVTLINMLMQQPYWKQTAVVILYDDSDGWYDHQMGADREPVHRAGRCPDRTGRLRHRQPSLCPASIRPMRTLWAAAVMACVNR